MSQSDLSKIQWGTEFDDEHLMMLFPESSKVLEKDYLRSVLKLACTLNPKNRMSWLRLLRHFYQSQTLNLDSTNLKLLLNIAIEWHDWPWLMSMLNTHKSLWLDKSAKFYSFYLALAHWQLADHYKANNQVLDGLLRFPEDSRWQCLYEAMIRDQNYINSRADFRYFNQLTMNRLKLVPLNEHHLEAFRWQYHDPIIADNTTLPVFSSDQDWLNWLVDDVKRKEHCILAIIHRDWGLIGVVGLEALFTENRPFIWLGADFRGQGHGKSACQLLQQGILACYPFTCFETWAYQDNEASKALLNQFGFKYQASTVLNNKEKLSFLRHD